MNNEQIIQEATEAVEKGLPCAFLVKPLLEVAKNQKLEIEILIRKKEALRDEIAEQQAEIERLRGVQIQYVRAYFNEFVQRLKSDCSLALLDTDLLNKVIDDLVEAMEVDFSNISDFTALIKSEAYREFAEKVKKISKEVTVPYIADTAIQEHKTGMFYYKREDFDNALNKLLSNDMGRYDHYTDSFVKEPTEINE